jgi:hypothetical protein
MLPGDDCSAGQDGLRLCAALLALLQHLVTTPLRWWVVPFLEQLRPRSFRGEQGRVIGERLSFQR